MRKVAEDFVAHARKAVKFNCLMSYLKGRQWLDWLVAKEHMVLVPNRWHSQPCTEYLEIVLLEGRSLYV